MEVRGCHAARPGSLSARIPSSVKRGAPEGIRRPRQPAAAAWGSLGSGPEQPHNNCWQPSGFAGQWRAVQSQAPNMRGSVQTSQPEAMLRNYRVVNEDLALADPGLNQQLVSQGTSLSQLFTQDDWERHRDVRRYWRHLRGVISSTVFQRVLEPVAWITSAAVALAAWNTFAPSMWGLPSLSLAPITHAVTGSLLSLMLVFRTNNANTRVREARTLLSTLVRCTRDLVRFSLYVPQQTGACREQLLRYTRAFPYALQAHVRKGRSRSDPNDPTAFRVDPSTSLTRVLGADTAHALTGHANIPLHMLMAMSSILHKSLLIGMSTQIHQQTELVLKELSGVTASCEKILSTPIPISYTRHTSRTLVIWLLSLPLVLWPILGWTMVPVIFVITYLMIGVDECGVQLEEPFCILPVQPLCQMLDAEVESLQEQALSAADFKPPPKK